MSEADIINKTREALNAALSVMRRTWIDVKESDDALMEAQENARFASELISDLRRKLKLTNS